MSKQPATPQEMTPQDKLDAFEAQAMKTIAAAQALRRAGRMTHPYSPRMIQAFCSRVVPGRHGDDESPCLMPGSARARSAAGGSGPTRE